MWFYLFIFDVSRCKLHCEGSYKCLRLSGFVVAHMCREIVGGKNVWGHLSPRENELVCRLRVKIGSKKLVHCFTIAAVCLLLLFSHM